MRWSEEDLQEFRQRQAKNNAFRMPHNPFSAGKTTQDMSEAEDCSEAKLQAKIEAYCKERGFYFFHDRSRACNVPGHPDLVVALHGGRVLWLELKAKSGRLSEDQKRVRLMLMALGHEFHELRSFKAFLDVLALKN
jgi:hypothetical protein